jgi:hypothetical protein
MNTYYHQQLMS